MKIFKGYDWAMKEDTNTTKEDTKTPRVSLYEDDENCKEEHIIGLFRYRISYARAKADLDESLESFEYDDLKISTLYHHNEFYNSVTVSQLRDLSDNFHHLADFLLKKEKPCSASGYMLCEIFRDDRRELRMYLESVSSDKSLEDIKKEIIDHRIGKITP